MSHSVRLHQEAVPLQMLLWIPQSDQPSSLVFKYIFHLLLKLMSYEDDDGATRPLLFYLIVIRLEVDNSFDALNDLIII